MKRQLVLSVVAALLALAPIAQADEQAIEILRQVDERDRGRDLIWDLDLTLTNRSGESRKRNGRIYRRKGSDDRSEQITVFLSPSNIRHTSFLTVDKNNDEDFMWLYLPALKKAKRVPAADRGSKFVGTDFSNEDVKLGFEFEDYDAEVLERDIVDGADAIVLSVTPKTDELKRSLGFDRSVATVRLDNYVMTDQKFFLREKLIKHNYARDIVQIDGIWTARELGSHDVINDHRTIIRIGNVRYDSGLDESFFSRRTLSREVYR